MIEQVPHLLNYLRINPNFIYNRFDLFDNEFVVLHIDDKGSDKYLEIRIKDVHVELGVWLMKISKADFKDISSYIFYHFPQIEYISFYNVISDKKFTRKNFFYLELPSTYIEMEKRLSSKSRQRLRRNKRDAAKIFGEMKFTEYNDTIPEEIVKEFFRLKTGTLGIDYHISCEEYLDKYHVSNAYVLSFGGRIAAIFFTCEQCPIVYGENFSYDDVFSYYSPGMLIYDLIIQRLIEKGKRIFYLGGGNYEYKKKYNSVEISVCEGRIYKNSLISFKYRLIDFYNRHILWKLRILKKKINLSL